MTINLSITIRLSMTNLLLTYQIPYSIKLKFVQYHYLKKVFYLNFSSMRILQIYLIMDSCGLILDHVINYL